MLRPSPGHQERQSTATARRGVCLKRQQPLFDRLTSAPAKILMESVTRQHPAMQNCFKPLWKEGIIPEQLHGNSTGGRDLACKRQQGPHQDGGPPTVCGGR